MTPGKTRPPGPRILTTWDRDRRTGPGTRSARGECTPHADTIPGQPKKAIVHQRRTPAAPARSGGPATADRPHQQTTHSAPKTSPAGPAPRPRSRSSAIFGPARSTSEPPTIRPGHGGRQDAPRTRPAPQGATRARRSSYPGHGAPERPGGTISRLIGQSGSGPPSNAGSGLFVMLQRE